MLQKLHDKDYNLIFLDDLIGLPYYLLINILIFISIIKNFANIHAKVVQII